MTAVSWVIAAAFVTFFVALLLSAILRPEAWHRMYQPEPWQRVMLWIVALFLAAFVGISMAGGSSILVPIVGILAFSAFYIAWRFLVASTMNRRRPGGG
jgi:hypothetical protein